MDLSPQHADPDRIAHTGETPVKGDNLMEQPLLHKDERIVSANPSPDAAIIGPSRDVVEQTQSSDAVEDLTTVPPINAFASHEQAKPYAGYVNSTGTWDGYSQYLNAADGLHISSVVNNDNPSLMVQSGYGFNPEMAYGQYSQLPAPLPSVMLAGRLYSPQQIASSPFYPQPATARVPSSVPLGPSELMASEHSGDSLPFGPGSGYLVHFGGNLSGMPVSSSLTSPAAYAQPMGILGPYEHHFGQASQQRPGHGYGLMPSSIGQYQHSGSYQSSNFSSGYVSSSGSSDWVGNTLDKGRRRERDQDSVYTSYDSFCFDHNRGPRASKLKGKGTNEQSSSSGNDKEDNSSIFGVQLDLCNHPDFVTDYENAKFFIIKSFSEDNVHKSIKYGVWASTTHGNKKMDAAYHEAKEMEGNCPVFLFFSVNASGQFCGVAEMVGPVDFEKDADYWQQDRWSGQFPVQWHIIKDVPNSHFRHILLKNNDNKPVTHSRDSQEVILEQGVEMLKTFKDHNAHTSILDDFKFYDQLEGDLKERKAKQQSNSSTTDSPSLLVHETVNQMSDSFAQALQVDDGSKVTSGNETVSSRADSAVSHANNSDCAQLVNHYNVGSQYEHTISHSLSHALKLEGGLTK